MKGRLPGERGPFTFGDVIDATGGAVNIEKHHKQEIASRHLETALLLYFAQKDLFSVITLAGAAEEMFGQLLRLRETGAKQSPFRSVLELLRPAKARAKEEHGGAHETDLYVHMDVRHEAEFLLGRAIDDYFTLTGELSVNMRKFNEEVRSRRG
ncbi:hypothetical protein [Geomonas subterranea]|uniref:hypothetical protein n=1 Tax=Geomonas subterranea TaxID=2847989 RepID=UPI001EF076FC|nr:hypothetical protein [Geomonas subterranea]